MSEIINRIEDYFNGQLSAREKEAFDNECVSNRAFAEEVAFYVATRDSLRQELYEEKKKQFATLHARLSQQQPVRKNVMAMWLPYAAAACVILLVGLFFFFRQPSPQTLAANYMDKNLQTLSVTMGGTEDSLQLGVIAYNKKNYKEAEQLFETLAKQETLGAEAIKNLGVVYLATERYTEAIAQFDVLAKRPDLYANPGLFYKAVAMLKRSTGSDKEEAKILLKEVKQKNLPGKKEAEEWLKKID